MADSISYLVRDVMESTETIMESAESMENITNESSKPSFEISSNMQEMAKVTTEQSMEIQSGSVAIEELAEKIKKIYSIAVTFNHKFNCQKNAYNVK